MNAICSFKAEGFSVAEEEHRSILGEIMPQLTDDLALLYLLCLLILTFGASHYGEFLFFTIFHAIPFKKSVNFDSH